VAALHELGAVELRRLFAAREASPVEALDAVAARIDATAAFNAFTALSLDSARVAAQEAERAYAAGEDGARPLLGIPVAVKDLIDTAGVRTGYGSPMFRDHVPERDAECVARLRAAGAAIVGKTSLFELAWGITSSNREYGDCPNPWGDGRTAGGSSGGSAVALALRQVPLALGTDTGGSIRIPAAFCGVTGLKPSWARLSTAGVLPLAPTLDHVGPMARSPEDLGLAMRALDGGEGWGIEEGVEDLRVGVWRGPSGPEPDEGTAAALASAAAALKRGGACVERVEDLDLDGALETFATVQAVEALESHTGLGLWPARRAGYPPVIAERLERAAAIPPARRSEAAEERGALSARLGDLFGRVDLLLSPVAPLGAPPLGEEGAVTSGTVTGLRDAVLGYTVPHSLAGIPSCAVRAGFGADGMPRGVQVAGPRGADRRVLRAAAELWRDDPELQARRPVPAGEFTAMN
jgi:aspartyl-tRNA(Asn)/glutamyl-tRNA(Gln) amidotransferase subunit A